MQLETMFEYQPQRQEAQIVYDVRSLESLSASALYTSDTPEYDRHVRDDFRGDDHEPHGEHVNYIVWMDRTGNDEGRSTEVSNTHILINDNDKD